MLSLRIEPLINLLYDQGKNAALEHGRRVATGLMIKPCDAGSRLRRGVARVFKEDAGLHFEVRICSLKY
jgi:hypothetical protein